MESEKKEDLKELLTNDNFISITICLTCALAYCLMETIFKDYDKECENNEN